MYANYTDFGRIINIRHIIWCHSLWVDYGVGVWCGGGEGVSATLILKWLKKSHRSFSDCLSYYWSFILLVLMKEVHCNKCIHVHNVHVLASYWWNSADFVIITCTVCMKLSNCDSTLRIYKICILFLSDFSFLGVFLRKKY